MHSQLRTEIVDFIVSNYLFGDAERTPADDESLMQSGVIDSTGILELIEFLETQFSISISEEETIPQNLDTIGNLTRFITTKAGPQEISA